MNKLIKYFALVSIIATVAISCSKENLEGVTANKKQFVTFVSEPIGTRTTFGNKSGESYPTLWTDTDKIHISVDGTNWPVECSVEPSADGRTAQFGAEVSVPTSGSMRYFAISPSSCYSYFYQSFYEYDFKLPTNQTPTATSCDAGAQILLARSEQVTAESQYVPMHFEHLTAYGKFSIKNLSTEAGAVKSVTLKATKQLTGYYELYWTESTPRIASTSNSAQKVVITTSSTEDIWFGCVPADLSGTSLEVTVVAENGDFTKKIDLTGKNLTFKAGEVSEFVVDMAGIETAKAAGKFTAGGESVACTAAVIGWDFGSWSKNMVINIGEVAGSSVREIQSGRYLSLSVNLEQVTDMSNFSIKDLSVYIYTSQTFSSTYCVGTASISMDNGLLKFNITDAKIPEGWSSTPTVAFSATYEGSYTEECSAYSTSNMTKDVNGNYKYYYGIDKLFVNKSDSATTIMFGNSSNIATANDIKNGDCGVKITVVSSEVGKLLDAGTASSKVEFYDYLSGNTLTAKSGQFIYCNMNGKTPYIYGYVYFDDQQNEYVEFAISCDAIESENIDLTPTNE